MLELKEILAVIRLTRTDGIGAVTFKRLLNAYGSAARAVEAADQKDLQFDRLCTRKNLSIVSENEALREYETGLNAGMHFLAFTDPAYPADLKHIYDAPPYFWYYGSAAVFSRPACGIVGSRNASLSARSFSGMLAEAIGNAGFCVVSGLARGADGAAHTHALSTPGGTVAVIAGGADVVYPPEHKKLYQEIIAGGGAVLSENNPGAEPIAKMFPRRNRIIAGLSLGVIVAEATLKSGSLTTARFALEQGREVFAVPGFPTDARSQGCNNLLKNGAILVRNADDVIPVLQELQMRKNHFAQFDRKNAPKIVSKETKMFETSEAAPECFSFNFVENVENENKNSEEKQILSLLGANDVTIDEIIRFSGLTTEIVLTILPQLEFSGKIIQAPGGAYRAV